ncbi:MAG: DnaJ domain-containing protein [Nitrospinae bacterium]|nr:DnaJ domain-containing protein [Nitrospinota bacterium]
MEKYYRLLNVSKDADLSDIKRAYRLAVHMYHPDANGGVGDPKKFKDVVIAYKYLQQHHKTFSIKPRRTFFGVFAGNIKTAFSSAKRGTTKTAKEEGPKRRRTARHDEFANLDPLILKLSFKELRLRLCKSDNDFVKRQSARALTYQFGAGALTLLKQELAESNTVVAEEMIYCLGLIGDRDSILVLEKYLRCPNVKLACASVKALQNINQGYAKALLEKIEREGRALRHAFLHLFENLRSRRFVKQGIVGHSELYIARFLRSYTRQPLPVILEELGFVLSK